MNLIHHLKQSKKRFIEDRICTNPDLAKGNFSSSLINNLTHCSQIQNYLEIGVQHGKTFEAVRARNKYGVDPSPKFSTKHLGSNMAFYKTTSDDFFSKLNKNIKFDFAFIDGLHTFDQTYRDFKNVLKHLTPDGMILLDDVIPYDSYASSPHQIHALALRHESGNSHNAWQGDVYKLAFLIAETMPFLRITTFVYPLNAQSLIYLVDPGAPFSVPETIDPRYSGLGFEEAFQDFTKTSKKLNFQFGWNAQATLRKSD